MHLDEVLPAGGDRLASRPLVSGQNPSVAYGCSKRDEPYCVKNMIAGLETEYGIMVENCPEMDPIQAAQLFFKFPGVRRSWQTGILPPSSRRRTPGVGWI